MKNLNLKVTTIVPIAMLASFAAANAQAHGTWVHGPGTYSLTLCAGPTVAKEGPHLANPHLVDGDGGGDGGSGGGNLATQHDGGRGAKRSAVVPVGPGVGRDGCDITGIPRLHMTLTLEAWGGGGGGSAGSQGRHKTTPVREAGGAGGAGGGGGGYGKAAISVAVPVSGATIYVVKVGSGGAAGTLSSQAAARNGQSGGTSEVRLNSTTGQILAQGAGGAGGHWGGGLAYSTGGGPGSGMPFNWTGTSGGNGAVAGAHDCNGAGYGLGGAGGGPGRTGPGYLNDGGDGGHGGYTNTLLCTAHGVNYLLSPGVPGGNGQVKISW